MPRAEGWSVLALIAAMTFGACTPQSQTGMQSLKSLWGLRESSFGQTDLFHDLLVGADPTTAQIKAVDLQTHQRAWQLPDSVSQTSGMVFTHDASFLYAVAASTPPQLLVIDDQGTVLQRLALPQGPKGERPRHPHVLGDRLYLFVGTGLWTYALKDLRTTNSTPLWTVNFADGSYGTSMAFDDVGQVYVSTRNAHLYAFNTAGQPRWTVSTSAPGTTSQTSADGLAVSGDTLIATVEQGLLQAYSTLDGGPRWGSQWPSYNTCPGGSAPAARFVLADQDLVYVLPEGGSCVLAFQVADGGSRWVFDAPNHYTFDSQPVVVGNVLYATNTNLWALDRQTGQPLGMGEPVLHTSLSNVVQSDAVRHQILVWGDELRAYAPLD